MLDILRIITSFFVVTGILWSWMIMFEWIEAQLVKDPIGVGGHRIVKLTSVSSAALSIVGVLFVLEALFERIA